MIKIKCSGCGLVNWSDAGACLRCGQPFEAGGPIQHGAAIDSYNNLLRNEDKTPRLKVCWEWVLDHRRLMALHVGLIVVVYLLSQTLFVNRWFVSKGIAAILQNLDERTRNETNPRLIDLSDRLTSLAVYASRGRTTAIRELIDLDIAQGDVSLPNHLTRPRVYMRDQVLTLAALASGAPDPGLRGSYRQRGATIGEYVSDILANVGEPAVEPIMGQIKKRYEAKKPGDIVYIPRGLLIALGRIRSPRSLDLLINCATSKPYHLTNIYAIEALSFFESTDPRLLQAYEMVLNERRTDRNSIFYAGYPLRVAIEGLVRLRSAASLQILMSHLDFGSSDYGADFYFVRAISRFGEAASPSVLKLVRDSAASLSARQHAVQVLGLLKASEARADLIALLDSPDLHETAAIALATWNREDFIPELEGALKRHPEWHPVFDEAIRIIKE